MKTIFGGLPVATALTAAVAATVAVPADAATRSYDVGAFEKIGVRGAYDVVVRSGQTASVRAEGDEDDLAHLVVRNDGDKLIVEREKTRGISLWDNEGPVRVLVTVPQLNGADLAGSGDLVVDRMEGDSVGLSLAGSGNLKVGAIEAERAKLNIAGSGDLTAGGSCSSGSVSIAGSGDVLGQNLTCRTVSVSVAGSGNVQIRATDTAKASIMGSGDVTITGGAKCRSSVMGSGDLKCS
ncbi:head GIN domain-containing protein [Pacificimonas flava]|uniref:Putative auto-transporter adhesin head GIN domain-containing protein n=1 Tax=Pacificimonas flava TaxID=1234595 RepID=M2T6K2_9SPHN|nr:head GIN domain-containing protein [Pacificimonas flava]EMD82149.1 hypothetical protein C725_2435 [Pacificimonas flava]MBB5280371.1 hypothetical protein [Pacificimonas flava]